jgi:hypothetical protein
MPVFRAHGSLPMLGFFVTLLAPEEHQKNDDRNRHANESKQRAFTLTHIGFPLRQLLNAPIARRNVEKTFRLIAASHAGRSLLLRRRAARLVEHKHPSRLLRAAARSNCKPMIRRAGVLRDPITAGRGACTTYQLHAAVQVATLIRWNHLAGRAKFNSALSMPGQRPHQPPDLLIN